MKVVKQNNKLINKIATICDMLFSLLTLPIALSYIEEVFTKPDSNEAFTLFVGAFVLMGIARLFRSLRFRGRSRMLSIKFLIYGILTLAGCLSAFVVGETMCEKILVILYLGSLIADRVISCLMNHRLRNLVVNLIAVALIIWVYIDMHNEADFLFLVMFFVAMHSLLCILSVAFARINLRALGKVVRQTYAAEVIAGLLLLIFAFSYILRFVEPNLNSLGDALWYCFAIVTTIGFGDITASSLIGRVLSVTLGIYGIIVVALITSVIVNFYGEMKRENVKEEDEEEGEEGEEKEEKA